MEPIYFKFRFGLNKFKHIILNKLNNTVRKTKD